MAHKVQCGLAALGLALAWAGAAPGNGAFPDEFSVHLPAQAPRRIFLGTNFGLVVSEDDGASWRYACEPYVVGAIANAILYQLAPDGAMFAASLGGLTHSADGGCTWTRSGGSLSTLSVTDFFVDPNDAATVLAVATGPAGSGIYPSHDGGLTFGSALYATTDRLDGVEISRSSPGVVYATASGPSATLLRSGDSGATWSATALPIPSGSIARIAAIDPVDANTVYLRLITPTTDAIAITTDGGKTLPPPAVSISGTVFSSFLRAADGALYAGTPGADLYVRLAGATSFTLRKGPHLRCLGQRPGSARIFGCGDQFLDGFNLGFSNDAAQTFQPLLQFSGGPPPGALYAGGFGGQQSVAPARLSGPLTCQPVQDACAAHWMTLQQTLGITAADAGVPGAGGGAPGPSAGGSHCASLGPPGVLAALAALALLLTRRRRRGTARDIVRGSITGQCTTGRLRSPGR